MAIIFENLLQTEIWSKQLDSNFLNDSSGWEGPELLDPSSNETYTWSVDIYGCGLVLACLMMWGSFSPKHFNQPKDLIKEVFMM
jgi:hypothetical protein